MIAQAVFLTNSKEIDEAIEQNKELGLNNEIPSNEYEVDEFTFRLADVSYVFLNIVGNISVCICGQIWTLKYDKEVYETIKKHLND